MGNCSGLFANCTGEAGDQNAVRRIDQDKMAMALAANREAAAQGRDMMGAGAHTSLNHHASDNYYN